MRFVSLIRPGPQAHRSRAAAGSQAGRFEANHENRGVRPWRKTPPIRPAQAPGAVAMGAGLLMDRRREWYVRCTNPGVCAGCAAQGRPSWPVGVAGVANSSRAARLQCARAAQGGRRCRATGHPDETRGQACRAGEFEVCQTLFI